MTKNEYAKRVLIGVGDGPTALVLTLVMDADTTSYDDLLEEAGRQGITPLVVGISAGAMFPVVDGEIVWGRFATATQGYTIGDAR